MKKHFIFLNLVFGILALIFFFIEINFLFNLFFLLASLGLVLGVFFLIQKGLGYVRINELAIKKRLVRTKLFSKLGLGFLLILISSLLYLFSTQENLALSIDLSQNALYTLSPLTLEALEDIAEPVTISLYAFKNEAKAIERFIKLYSQENSWITFERKNLGQSFIEMNRNDITASGTLLLSRETENKVEKKIKILPEQIIKNQALTKSSSLANVIITYERVINASLKSLFSPPTPVYFLNSLKGRAGESDLGDLTFFKESLSAIGFELIPLSNLKQINLRPNDVLLVFDLDLTLKEDDIKAITKFIETGGKIFYLIEPNLTPSPSQASSEVKQKFNPNLALLNDLGVEVNYNRMVVDNENYYVDYFDALGNPKKGSPLIPLYTYKKRTTSWDEENETHHPIVHHLAQLKWEVIFKTVLPLSYFNSNKFEVSFEPLIESKVTAWGEKNLAEEIQNRNLSYNSGVDKKPPLFLALAGVNIKNGFKIIILGDIDLIRNETIREGVNETLVQNILFWLTGQKGLISAGFKKTNSSRKVFSREENFFFSLIFLLIIPLGLIFLFLIFYKQRQSKTL